MNTNIVVPSLDAPEWPAPPWVKAFSTTRERGYSLPPFQQLNVGDHVGDAPETVALNRGLLKRYLGDELRFNWLEQVHGTRVLSLDGNTPLIPADATTTAVINQVCVIMTADCLPVLFTNQPGSCVAAAHAGWRGLCDGVLEATVTAMGCPAETVMAWLGPAIGPSAFQVGSEVRDAFCRRHQLAEQCFIKDATAPDKWLANIYQLAKLRLRLIGVESVYGQEACTYAEPDRYFSYRRDGQTGRMATGIWLSPQTSVF